MVMMWTEGVHVFAEDILACEHRIPAFVSCHHRETKARNPSVYMVNSYPIHDRSVAVTGNMDGKSV